MNREAILELADFIERAEYEFRMSSAIVDLNCGSAGCIGGHAAVLWPDEIACDLILGSRSFIPSSLAAKLDMPFRDFWALCYGAPGVSAMSDITREMAIAALRRLADTGVVEFRLEDRS